MFDLDIFKKEFAKEKLYFKEPMNNHTSFKIGGPADLMIKPECAEDIAAAIELCGQYGTPLFVMGNGSNLLVGDRGFRGVIVKISKGFSEAELTGAEKISSCSGISLSALANFALEQGLGGMEFASGIPGTLGGAVFMNAGAYDGEMKDIIETVEVMEPDGKIKIYNNQEMGFGYRTSGIQNTGAVVLKAGLNLSKDNHDSIKAIMDKFNASRKEKQPLEYPSAGSTFKRPDGYFAAKLIMDSGLRGFSIGGAQVSEKHCGFVINKGGATAQNVLDLIEHIKETVYKSFNVAIEPEIRVIGE